MKIQNRYQALQILKALKNDAQIFQENIEIRINDLINNDSLSYQESSKLSYSIDRLRIFLSELNDFQISTQNKENE